MRTTLTIDDDILAVVRSRASAENRTLGDVLSDLARTALRSTTSPIIRSGLPILRRSHLGVVVTPEIIKELAEDGI